MKIKSQGSGQLFVLPAGDKSWGLDTPWFFFWDTHCGCGAGQAPSASSWFFFPSEQVPLLIKLMKPCSQKVFSSCAFSSRCVLGNTTILAEFASEEEISRFFAQSQSLTPSPGWQSLGSSQSRLGSLDCSHSFSSRTDLNHWNGAGLSGTNCGDLHGTSLWGTPHYSTSLWGPPSSSDPRGISSPSPINAFLSVDHLGGGGESM